MKLGKKQFSHASALGRISGDIAGGFGRCNPQFGAQSFFDLQRGPGVKEFSRVTALGGTVPHVSSLHTSEGFGNRTMQNTDWPSAFTDEAKALAFTYTKAARREIRRRENIMADWRRLIGEGMSKEAAAKALRQSSVTLWRWSRRLLPNTFRCGQHSAFEKLNVPLQVISRVQRLCVAGMKQEEAWRSVAKEKFCPPALAEYLSQARNIPPSFLKASRLSKFSLKVIKGVDFTIMEKRLL